MSYPAYPEYKESGVDWLEQMPSHWTVKRLRHVTDLNPGKSRVRGYDPEMETTFLPMEAVGEDGSLDLTATRLLSDVIDGYTYFQEDDVAYAKITPCFENGKAAILRGLKNGIGFGTTELTILRPHTDQAKPDYLFRVITSEPFRSLGESSMYGAGGQKRVPDDFARNFSIPWPPLPEQTQIARFLDHQTARIDALIAEQQRLIELLKEKRQAVISHAVTKGLDPDVAMKDSGVEWFGEVPAHWDVTYLKMLVDVRDGTHETPSYVSQSDFSFPLVTSRDVTGGSLNLEECNHISADDYYSIIRRSGVAKGDILMPMIGTVGTPLFLYDDCQIAIKNLALFKTSSKYSGITPTFLFHFLTSNECKLQFDLESRGGVQSFVSLGTLRNLSVPLAPNDEQRKIVEYIEVEAGKIDDLTRNAEQGISLLAERRSALISAAVTGKIDVRNWEPPVSETFPQSTVSEEVSA